MSKSETKVMNNEQEKEEVGEDEDATVEVPEVEEEDPDLLIHELSKSIKEMSKLEKLSNDVIDDDNSVTRIGDNVIIYGQTIESPAIKVEYFNDDEVECDERTKRKAEPLSHCPLPENSITSL